MQYREYHPETCWNQAVYEDMSGFDPQQPIGPSEGTLLGPEGTPPVLPGVQYLGNGKATLRFYAPYARKVSVRAAITTYEMVKDENGYWEYILESEQGGFMPLAFSVDGTEVLNPMAPIGFGASKPINYVDIPGPEEAFYELRDVPHGSVTSAYYYSSVTDSFRKCLVYTPPCYMDHPEERYPVLYLQHGHGENENCWIVQGKANLIIDNLIAEKKAQPFIAVMNNGMVQKAENGVFSVDPSLFEEMLLQDCIPFIEKKYRVSESSEKRAIAGLSMGSLQASSISLSHPDLFSYVGVFSGFVQPLPGLGTKNADYLKTLENRDLFEKSFRIFFRAAGYDDPLCKRTFDGDSELFRKNGLSPENVPGHVVKFYNGSHEWNVWRKCLRDFSQMLFQDNC